MPKSLKMQAGLLAASRAAGQVLNAAVSFVAARKLAQGDFGTFRQIYLLFATLLLVTDLGLVESLYYFLPRFPRQVPRLVARALLVLIAAQVVVFAGIVMLRGRIGASFENPALSDLMVLFGFFLGFSVCTRLWEVQLIAEQRIVAAGIVSGGFEALKAILLFAVLFTRPTVYEMVWALVLVTGVKFASFVAFLGKDLRGAEPATVPAREWMGYSVALWIPGAVNILANQAHQFIVGLSFTPQDFALYSVACFQLPMLGVLTTSVIEVMLVRITAARAEGRHDEVVRVWHAATAQSMVFFIPLVAGLAALAVPLVTLLFTARYAAAAPLFVVLSFSLPLTAIYTNNVLRAFGAMKAYTVYYFFRLALSLGLGWIGVTWFGMWGVAISSVIALYLVTFLQLGTVAKLLQLPFRSVLPLAEIAKVTLASLLAAMPAAASARWLPNPIFALAAGGASFSMAYVFLGLQFGFLDKNSLQRLWPR